MAAHSFGGAGTSTYAAPIDHELDGRGASKCEHTECQHDCCRQHEVAFDERVAGKGASVVASLLKKMVDMEVARSLRWVGHSSTSSSGAKAREDKLWNTIIMRVIQDMLLKGSPVYAEGLERIDVKCCVRGHSCVCICCVGIIVIIYLLLR